MPQTLIELGGEQNAPIINLAPANGFVPQTYIPMLRPLMDDHRVLSTPPKALWGDADAPELPDSQTWYDFSVEMISAYEQFGLEDVITIGHSIGGIMTILAAIQRPDLFKTIIMLDPVIMPTAVCDWIKSERQEGKVAAFPLAELARRRRSQFESVDEAFQNFHGKSIFADWSDEVLQLYVEHGTTDCDGQRCLTWSPAWEAYYYSTYYADIWQELPKLNDLGIPMLFITAENSDIFTPDMLKQVQEKVPNASYEMIKGQGHLFPQSAPDETAIMMSQWLETIYPLT